MKTAVTLHPRSRPFVAALLVSLTCLGKAQAQGFSQLEQQFALARARLCRRWLCQRHHAAETRRHALRRQHRRPWIRAHQPGQRPIAVEQRRPARWRRFASPAEPDRARDDAGRHLRPRLRRAHAPAPDGQGRCRPRHSQQLGVREPGAERSVLGAQHNASAAAVGVQRRRCQRPAASGQRPVSAGSWQLAAGNRTRARPGLPKV